VRGCRFIAILALAFFTLTAHHGVARAIEDAATLPEPMPLPDAPDRLEALQNIKKENPGKGNMPFDLRNDAQKQAALSYGARGGLAAREYQIRKELEMRAPHLDKIFDFRQLLIPAPSGLLIEPPVISEEQKAMIISSHGREAAVADRIYNITVQAKIVGTAHSWRNYLERDWSKVTPPPDLLRPANPEERKKWREWVAQGWKLGIAQADEIFQDDLNELTADYQGMIRYRMLLAQGMVSPPYATQHDRGVTGGGKMMRIGDREVLISSMPELVTGTEAWQPASR
jgi:defect-in-organelle-trafficking protein DotC